MNNIREDITIKQQPKAKQEILTQYYNFISLLKVTKDFESNYQTYEGLQNKLFTSPMAIIGTISGIQVQSSDPETGVIIPTIITRIPSSVNWGLMMNRHEQGIKYKKFKTVLSYAAYKQKMIIPLNKIINQNKKQKNKNYHYAFLGMKTMIKRNKQVYFAFTNQSYIIQIDQQYYCTYFKPLEDSLFYKYSQIDLRLLFQQNNISNSTFYLQQIRDKLYNLNDYFTITGLLTKINYNSMQKPVNPKQKQAALQFIQDIIPNNSISIGKCLFYIRFDIADTQQFIQYLQQGCKYILIAKQIYFTQSLTISFKCYHWRQNFIKIPQEQIQKYIDLQNIAKKIQSIPISLLQKPILFRNIYKFKVQKFDLKFFFVKVQCEKCGAGIIKIRQFQYRCRNGCGQVNTKINIWFKLLILNQGGPAQISLQDEEALQFFNLHQQCPQIKQQVIKQSQITKGIVLYHKSDKKDFSQFIQQGSTYDKNQYLLKIIKKCLVMRIERQILATPKIVLNQRFDTPNDESKNDYQLTFMKGCKRFKYFINGKIKQPIHKNNNRILFPFLKVIKVLD